MVTYAQLLFFATWGVLLEMAPYLLFGFFVAGLLSVMISPAWIEKHLSGRGFVQILKATLFGIPLPLCSCGVIPVAASLRRNGASRSATTAFLLSTPQTGVDSIALTLGLMGPFLAIFRPIVAFATGLLGGGLVEMFDRDGDTPKVKPKSVMLPVVGQPKPTAAEDDFSGLPWGERLVKALRYGFLTLPRDISKHLVVGILLAGLITALIPPGALGEYMGGGFGAMLVAMLVGIPLYTCATSSTPIAMSLIYAGVSPGAALVFLITGPATNTATIATIWKVLGKRTALIYLTAVGICGIGSGLLLDGIIASGIVPKTALVRLQIPAKNPASNSAHLAQKSHAAHANSTSSSSEEIAATAQEPHAKHGILPPVIGHLVDWVSVPALFLVMTIALLPKRKKSATAPPAIATAASSTTIINFKVTGMHCESCVSAIERALREFSGVQAVEVDLAAESVRVEGSGEMTVTELQEAMGSLGYEAEVTTSTTGGTAVASTVFNFKVTGMHCQSCVNAIERALGEFSGVQAVDVDLAAESVRVEVSGEKTVTELQEAIGSLGYEAEVV